MLINESIRVATEYLYNAHCYDDEGIRKRFNFGDKNILLKESIDKYKLHSSLQFHLCKAYDRLSGSFHNCDINSKDIIFIVEAWIASANNSWEFMLTPIGWRKVSGLILKSDCEPQNTALSEKCPRFNK